MGRCRSVRRKLSAAAELRARDWALLVQAAFWLLVVDLGLRTLGFSRVRALLAGRSDASKVVTPSGSATGEIERLYLLVAIAARHHLYRIRCLPRSLVLQRLLARRGIAADLRIGARKDGDHFEAHAWLERDRVPIGEGRSVRERFSALELYRA